MVNSLCYSVSSTFFFFNDPATTEIYTLSLHDALPICRGTQRSGAAEHQCHCDPHPHWHWCSRSEEHTSELQSQFHLVCRLLLEKKKVLLAVFAPLSGGRIGGYYVY